MGHAARQAVKDPGVHSSEKDLPLTCPGLKSRHFFEDPLDLRRRKIRIRDKARLISYFFDEFRIGGLQFFNKGRRSSALPDDRVINGASRVLFPKDRRFSLVRDTDAGDLAGLDIGLGQSLTDTVAHRSPEVFRIVFDPARLRVVLVKGLLRRGHASAILPEDHGTRRCGSLVDRKHVLTHRRLLFAKTPPGKCFSRRRMNLESLIDPVQFAEPFGIHLVDRVCAETDPPLAGRHARRVHSRVGTESHDIL